ncbi:hypothetical protein PsorP6_001406 [Peronosclerospora sorghi]|uniref:Uncharacterized protein n=1 Tax=Peronosclerospora sorghi TaxID=230839 RepID=A0ACC0WZM9_9STRA|nr:hypothetical protein PsorP6_001406 [Peronosclerospora sorghi]
MQAKSHFATQEEADTLLACWKRLCASGDDTAYRRNLAQFSSCHLTTSRYSRNFVKSWCDLVPHYGNAATTRAEGAHARLKTFLAVSTDALGMFDALEKAWQKEVVEAITAISRENTVRPTGFGHSLYRDVNGRVSTIFALRKVQAASVGAGKATRWPV